MTSFKNALEDMSANARAMLSGVQGLAFVIVVMGVIFGDVAFIWMFNDVFPAGIWRIATYIGVFATTFSVIGLFIGKTHWFRPGGQIIWAWIFAGIELFVVIVNTIAAFSVARTVGHIDPNLELWITYVSPATPLIAVIGWFLITWFSPERAISHKRMEMQDKLAAEQIAVELEIGRAQIQLQRQYIKAGQAHMNEQINAPHIQKQVQQTAANQMAEVLGKMTGQYIVPSRVTDMDELVEARQNGHNGTGAPKK